MNTKGAEESTQIDTGGGAYIERSVTAYEFVGRDKIVGYTASQVAALLDQLQQNFQPKPFDGRCPYVGLRAFEELDADRFFGRDALIADLVARVKSSRCVIVAGPSGSGKSSLVRAGLVPALKGGKLPGSEHWLYETLKPGRSPLTELARTVSTLAGTTNAGDEIMAKGRTDPTLLHRWLEIALKDDRARRAVLLVDQFEEIFTPVAQQEERTAFFNLLTYAAMVEQGRTTLLFTVRSDFVAYFADYAQLNALLNQQFLQVASMQPAELVQAIAQPALQLGLRIDPDLVAQIVDEMQSEPGALPLMQFSLTDLFQAQQSKGGVIALTRADYQARGGLYKALERHADTELGKLSAVDQQRAGAIFKNLIQVGQGTQDTRRTVLFHELVPAGGDEAAVQAVVQALAAARLFITGEEDDQQTVTLAHEKLIEAWPWLRTLVNENRASIALQNQINEDAQTWQLHEQENSYLYTGARLTTVQEQLATHQLTLSRLAQDFVGAAAMLARRNRRLRLAAVVVGIFMVGAIVLTYVTGQQRINQQNLRATEQAQSNATIAVAATAQARAAATAAVAKETAEAARSEIENLNRFIRADQLANKALPVSELPAQRALLLAVEAVNIYHNLGKPPLPIAEENLHALLAKTGGEPLAEYEEIVNALAFSPDGKLLAIPGEDNTVRLWDVAQPQADPIVLHGHTDSVNVLAFSPDGKLLASAGEDSTVRLWDVAQPQADPIELTDHVGSISAVVFSPKGKFLASASVNGRVWLWDVARPQANPVILRGQEAYYSQGSVYTLAFSPDGKLLASAGDDDKYLAGMDSTVRLWDMAQPQAAPIELRGRGAVYTLVFSPDGKLLASAGEDGTVRLWDVAQPQAAPIELPGHEGFASAVVFSPPDGKYLASMGQDGVRLWDMAQPQANPVVLHGQEDHALGVSGIRQISGLTFSPDGKYLAGASGSALRLWDMTQLNADPVILRGHEDIITTVVFSPDGKYLASAGFSMAGFFVFVTSVNSTVRLWQMTQPAVDPIILRGHEGAVATVDFSPDGSFLASTGQDGTVQLWDMAQPQADSIEPPGHENAVIAAAFSPDGKRLAGASPDGAVRLWDMTQPQGNPMILSSYKDLVYGDYVYDVVFSPDGKLLATISNNGTLRLRDVAQPQAEPIELPGRAASSSAVVFSPDGRFLASSGSLWDMAQPQADPIGLPRHERPDSGVFISPPAVVFSPDGKYLASTGQDGIVRLWDMAQPHADPIELPGRAVSLSTLSVSLSALAFSPDGKLLAGANRDNLIRLWDVAQSAADPIILSGHEAFVSALAFSPDSNRLASASLDSTVRFWDMTQPNADPVVLRGHAGELTAVAFSPDGKRLASASVDSTVRLWTARIDDLVSLACRIAGRNLKQTEWEQYFPDDTYHKTCPDMRADPAVVKDLLDEGEQLASQGDLTGAIVQFRQALALNPALAIDPEMEAKHFLGQSLVNEAHNIARDDDIDEAVAKFQEALTVDPSLKIEPETEAKRIAASGLVTKANSLVWSGDYQEAILAYARAQSYDPSVAISAEEWYRLCRLGSTHGFAADVLPACEQAVKLEPNNDYMRDSRGLARALTGDIKGAIADFQTYVTASLFHFEERKTWIADLKAGKDPADIFTPAVLEKLQNE